MRISRIPTIGSAVIDSAWLITSRVPSREAPSRELRDKSRARELHVNRRTSTSVLALVTSQQVLAALRLKTCLQTSNNQPTTYRQRSSRHLCLSEKVYVCNGMFHYYSVYAFNKLAILKLINLCPSYILCIILINIMPNPLAVSVQIILQ